MWNVDNDLHRLRQLEHDLAPRKMERLLNTITIADREPVFRPTIAPLGSAIRALFKLLRTLPATLHLAGRNESTALRTNPSPRP